MKLPTLYHKSKTGKLYSWRVWCEGPEVHTEYGTVDGKKTRSHTTATPKNIGKANATTSEQQAINEAQALWANKLERKYRQTIEGAQETIFLPMLAYALSKIKKPIPYPVDVQPKLDGVRCLAFWKDGKLDLMSRSGKRYNVEHLKKALEVCLPHSWVLDGELYVHKLPLQSINALVKKHRPGDDGSVQLKLRVFDIFNKANLKVPWHERRKHLDSFFLSARQKACIKKVPTEEVSSEAQLYEKLSAYENQGYEGIIIRLRDGLYALGQRSRSLIKLKNFKDAEFPIVGFSEASGNDAGTVVWTCSTPEGVQFGVRPKGTREDRTRMFQNAQSFVGKMLTVKYQSLTMDKVPQFPVGIGFRNLDDV